MSDEIVRYEHHGWGVAVRKDLQGKHRDHCLCWRCLSFMPDDRAANCVIANYVYRLCVDFGLTLPVWECPEFIEKVEEDGVLRTR